MFPNVSKDEASVARTGQGQVGCGGSDTPGLGDLCACFRRPGQSKPEGTTQGLLPCNLKLLISVLKPRFLIVDYRGDRKESKSPGCKEAKRKVKNEVTLLNEKCADRRRDGQTKSR